MTRRLARLADIAYRRRGRDGPRLDRRDGRDHRARLLARGRVQRRLQHAGLGVEGGERPHRAASSAATPARRSTSSGRTRPAPTSPAARQRIDAFFAEAEQVEHIDQHTPIRVSDDGTIATTTLPLTVPGWEVDEGARRTADRRRRGQQRRRPRDQARRRPDLPGAQEAVQPRGARLPRRGDRAADRLRLAGRRRPAAGDRPGRPRHHLRRPDPAARQRRRRPRLDHGGLRA